jgi:S-formylglutathione hydrolase FrmB
LTRLRVVCAGEDIRQVIAMGSKPGHEPLQPYQSAVQSLGGWALRSGAGISDWRLTAGPLPTVVTIIGIAALGFLLLSPRRWWRGAPLAVALSGVAVIVSGRVLGELWTGFPHSLPYPALLWSGFAFLGAALALTAARRASRRRRLAAIGALVAVVTTALLQINRHYGQFPTVESALGMASDNEIVFTALTPPTGEAVRASPGTTLRQAWRPPADMPAAGRVTHVQIPGTISGFHARPAWIYLPPAYLGSKRAALPVLVLLAGIPGSPSDWLTGGRLAQRMDHFASRNRGLAPVVVMPDDTGSLWANPLCLDSRLGNVETYLTRDVPDWIARNLEVNTDTRYWAVGGLSYGGTCALQLAVRQPRVFPTFLDMSGPEEVTLGDRGSTVRAAFGGDESRFRQVNSLDILATRKFPDTAAMIVIGTEDSEYLPAQRTVFRAAQRAGMNVGWAALPGGHTWDVWGPALTQSLPWLAVRGGLLAAEAP